MLAIVKSERCSRDSGFPLTRPRNNTGPASPPLGRGRIAGRSGSPRPSGGEAGRGPARTGEGDVDIPATEGKQLL